MKDIYAGMSDEEEEDDEDAESKDAKAELEADLKKME